MKKYIFVIITLITFQSIFVFFIFPFHRLALEKPLLNVDYGIHYYQTIQTIEFLKISGRTWGYDPYFMAGHPTALVSLADNFGFTLTVAIFSLFMSLPVAIKVVLVMILVSLPVIIFISCRNFSFSIDKSFLVSLALIVILNSFWWYATLIGVGMFSFVISIFLAILTLSYFYRYLKEGKIYLFICYVFFGAYMLSMHPLSSIVLLCFIVCYFIFNRKDFFSSRLAHLLGGGLLIVIANLYWIIPLMQFSKYYESKHIYLQSFGLSAFLKHIRAPRQALFHFFMLCALVSPFLLRKDKSKAFVFSTWLVFVLMYLISYFAVGPVEYFSAHIESARFLIVAGVLAPVLVAIALCRFFSNQIKAIIVFFCLILIFQMGIGFCFIFGVRGKTLNFVKRLLFPNFMQGRMISRDIMKRLGEGLTKKALKLTDNSARILIEDSAFYKRNREFARFAPILQCLTQREFIGGHHGCVKAAYAYFWFMDGKLRLKPINDVEIKKFMRYMDLYNIKWIFVHSPDSKQYLKSYPEYFTYISSYKKYCDIYAVNRDPSFFIKGKGKIQASLDKIIIAKASKGDIIIKYHYLETLKTRPQVGIEEFKIMDDPVGFIKINNEKGYDTIEIYN